MKVRYGRARRTIQLGGQRLRFHFGDLPPRDVRDILKQAKISRNTGLDGIVWNILGQIYVPKSLNEQSFSWHVTLPPRTFVPPHIHPTQDDFIYMLDGQFDLRYPSLA